VKAIARGENGRSGARCTARVACLCLLERRPTCAVVHPQCACGLPRSSDPSTIHRENGSVPCWAQLSRDRRRLPWSSHRIWGDRAADRERSEEGEDLTKSFGTQITRINGVELKRVILQDKRAGVHKGPETRNCVRTKWNAQFGFSLAYLLPRNQTHTPTQRRPLKPRRSSTRPRRETRFSRAFRTASTPISHAPISRSWRTAGSLRRSAPTLFLSEVRAQARASWGIIC
jgi:hypothetical protein